MDRYRRLIADHPQLVLNPDDAGIAVMLEAAEIAAIEAAAAASLRERGFAAAAAVGVVSEDPYWIILRDAVRFPDGNLGSYLRRIRQPLGAHTVGILPIWNGQVLLLQNFRHAARGWRLEIPRGFGEEGDSPEANARRELIEEMSAVISDLVPLGYLEADSGLTVDQTDLFLAHVERYGATSTAEGIAAVSAHSIPKIEAMILEGVVNESFTISAFARARLRKLI